MQEKVKVGIIGLGMVGQPHRRWFEEIKGYKRGKDLFCYDTDPALSFFDDISKATVIFVAVPTPPNSDGSCNISIVDQALSGIKSDKVVVIKSTIPPGTTEMFQAKYSHLRILFCPEFLTEVQAWEDFLHPTRQLIGYTGKSKGDSMLVLNLLPPANFSSPWAADYSRFELTATEAEYVKYVSNVFGAIKVTFANIVYDFCQAKARQTDLKIDYENIRKAVSADPRMGPSWLDVHHGICRGFTGYCFPKDLNAFVAFGRQLIQRNRDGEGGVAVENALLSYGVEGVLSAVRRYNTALLVSQNLTEEEVSKHDSELK
ncbi:MAG: hypothetical protein A3C71_00210 [Candidatus Yanofskybacteria bacterium RIFCSPHIGHO2_02_FULL_43_15c]|uniref:UDP-glucose/GDP-mannose dehydrogenase dimerisation domain-containing protein n=1 Tax=Candidatus Yanofskybacteria bacterium RIFCSPHIGHO2_02_FULL_43_15c TaxID=1802679 RepID=A0A1F8FK65_9BACT|nr:MAG: hypothetical protein A3C71_00210 [Candidatus Yanofskybacteria bacterium RIFCSPHIGHO2_02_FULL_43_15c]